MARWQASERSARYRKRRRAGYPQVVSEGDSWFDYPFFRNMIDLIDDAELFAHLRLEASGETAKEMIGTASAVSSLRTVVEEVHPLCLLFSGGGNDLAAAARRLFRKGTWGSPAKYLVSAEVNGLLGRLEAFYEKMISGIGPTAPIFAHGYDYFAPSSKSVRINGVKLPIGPWIHPALLRAEIESEQLQRDITGLLVDRFNSMLERLAASRPLDFVYVDLRGTLDIDEDWENEIHPTRRGFQKVADRFMSEVKQRLPSQMRDRLATHLVDE